MELKGNAVSQGIAIGEVFLYTPFKPVVEESYIEQEAVEQNLARYRQVKEAAKNELENIVRTLEADDPEKAKIFTAHIDILFDEAMEEEILEAISDDLLSPEYAIQKIYEKFIKILSRTKDPLIQERAADLRDVRGRLLRIWFGVEEKNLSALSKPVIVAAHDLFPSDTATLDRSKVLAILTEIGGSTSHSAIIARSYEIPAVLGIPNLMSQLQEGQHIIADALKGKVIADPTAEQIAEYEKAREKYLVQAAELKRFKDVEPVTPDGQRVDITLNIGSAEPVELEGSHCTDGVGLFRSEFLYMGRETLPSEDEQYGIYKRAVVEFGERPVILRTLDIGGDKKLDSMQLPVEENPFLGLRAVRLCFAYMDIFKTQLRAALRAGQHGNLWIMFPMIGSIDDIRRCKAVVQEVRDELDAQNTPYGKNVKIGIMVEIPSIAVAADLAAQEVDFASIGTNDLCQYLTAVDRMNPTVSQYYQSYHPSMFRVIKMVVDAFKAAGKPVSVCGEMGGDPVAAAVLIGLGFRKLSMGIASVASIKKLVTGLSIDRAEKLAQRVLMQPTAADVEALVRAELAGLLS